MGGLSLGELFAQLGSDKGAHGYGQLYERHVDPATVLELGVQRGGSLNAWVRWFGARVWGVDRDATEGQFPDGVTFIRGDVTRPETFLDVPDSLDLIVDDASHDLTEVAASYEILWPRVAPGGCYVVEDLHAVAGWQGWLGDRLGEHAAVHLYPKIVFMQKGA